MQDKKPRTHGVMFRCKPEDRARWKALAHRRQMGLGELIRFLLDAEDAALQLPPQGRPVPPRTT